MSVFKIDIFYKAFFFAALAALAALAACYRNDKIYILLLAVIIIFIVILIYTLALKVETDGIDLKKKTIFGKKEVNLKEVAELSVISLRGRYVFFFITQAGFVMISSALADFEGLRAKIFPCLSEDCQTKLESIPLSTLKKKSVRFKISLVFLLLLAVGVLFWRSYDAGFGNFNIIR